MKEAELMSSYNESEYSVNCLYNDHYQSVIGHIFNYQGTVYEVIYQEQVKLYLLPIRNKWLYTWLITIGITWYRYNYQHMP